MARKFPLFAKRFFLFLNVLAIIVYLLSAFAPYLDPSRYWFISLMGLGFAFIFLIQLLFIIFWLIANPRFALLSLITLFIGWKSISVFFGFHITQEFSYRKPKDTLRVVHWNVARFIEWSRNNNKGSKTRLKMMEQIRAQNADVLCLSEFYHSTDSIYYDNLNYVRKKLNYPYFYYSWDDDGGNQWVGQAIFSRYPIIDSGKLHYPRPTMPEALIHADVVFKTDTIRFYTTHLQSVLFKKSDYEKLQKIKNTEDSLIENSKNIFVKLKNGSIHRSRQSAIVRNEISKSPYPFVLTGDMNDVPNSHTYFTISENLQDAFLKKGFGVGRTYAFISPTLRIDYILATKDFEIKQFDRIAERLSDHYMLVADVQLRSK
jgi:endonuclease/exonuclease/phosphatase family metal-dependent hydrolase